MQQEAANYIHSLGRFSGAPGLHRIRALLAALGNPQQRLRFVHLAGTNGKGSTAAITAEVMQHAGYRVGLFTSPYLVEFRERIRVNGAMIAGGDLARLTGTVRRAADTLALPQGEHIGEFEFVTAVGMLYFLEQSCELVVLETGLGGEFDATNAIDAPLVCAITSISLDHTAVLGSTIAEIARAKAGIIKAGSAVVCAAHQTAEAQRVIADACRAQGILCAVAQDARVISCDLDGSVFRFSGHEYHLSLVGRHQIENACTALGIVAALRARGFAIAQEAAHAGLQSVRFAGRFERMAGAPLTILDGAHNPGGVAALCRTLDECLAGRALRVVMGMVRDKAVAPCVHELARRAAAFFACTPENERALPSTELAALAAQDCANVTDCGSLCAALAAAVQGAAPEDCVLVCGSLYLVGDAEKIFAARQKAAE